mgnify:CR=1 FL=1
MAGARAYLEDLLQQPVEHFAYPNGIPGGDYDGRHVEILCVPGEAGRTLSQAPNRLLGHGAQLGVPVFLMTGPTTPDPRFNDPAPLANVARAFPQLPIVCYHGWWPNVAQAIGLAFRYENIHLVPDMYLFVAGSKAYVEAANGFMADQFLFGSSYPFRPIQQSIRDFLGGYGFHGDQALALLGQTASAPQREVLAAVRYQSNRAVLHTDPALLPRDRKLWSAWNYFAGNGDPGEQPVAVSYLINRLQPLPFATPVVVTLNPAREPEATKVIAEFDYAHPIFDGPAIAAQQRLASVQGKNGIWLAGPLSDLGASIVTGWFMLREMKALAARSKRVHDIPPQTL